MGENCGFISSLYPEFFCCYKSKKKMKDYHFRICQIVQSSMIQWDDLSEIHDFFAVPLTLLRRLPGDHGFQFENHCFETKLSSFVSLRFQLVLKKVENHTGPGPQLLTK